MPVYQLHPVEERLGSVHWNYSTYRGPCLVTAESEAAARNYATREFAFTAKSPLPEWIAFNPWTKPEFVACTAVTGIDSAPQQGAVVRL
jgi:hypothetical protein